MRPKIAIVHDYLTQRGGAERVALEIAKAFPGAPIYTSFYEPSQTFPEFGSMDVRPSSWNRARAFRSDPRRAFPLLPRIFSSLRVEADVVICSSSGWSHAVQTSGKKIVYCHTPARWLWAPEDYFKGLPRPIQRIVGSTVGLARAWDARAARSADSYLANSTVVKERILRAYAKESTVLHPPASVGGSALAANIPFKEGDFYLTVGRPRGYKNTKLAVDAFEGMPARNLVVVGDGWASEDPQPNTTFLSGVSDGELRWLYSNARAVIALSHEDFGLTPVEAFSLGTPAIALRAGGYLDSCIEGTNAVFVDELTVEALKAAIFRLEDRNMPSVPIVDSARRFDPAFFRSALLEIAEAAWSGN